MGITAQNSDFRLQMHVGDFEISLRISNKLYKISGSVGPLYSNLWISVYRNYNYYNNNYKFCV